MASSPVRLAPADNVASAVLVTSRLEQNGHAGHAGHAGHVGHAWHVGHSQPLDSGEAVVVLTRATSSPRPVRSARLRMYTTLLLECVSLATTTSQSLSRLDERLPSLRRRADTIMSSALSSPRVRPTRTGSLPCATASPMTPCSSRAPGSAERLAVCRGAAVRTAPSGGSCADGSPSQSDSGRRAAHPCGRGANNSSTSSSTAQPAERVEARW